MSGAAGSRNQFRNAVLVGNWNEDRWGADLVSRVQAANPRLETTEYRSHFQDRDRIESKPALKAFETIDGHLLMAHGKSDASLAARTDPPERFMTITHATFKGASTSDALHGRIEAPRELARTELIESKARLQISGVDPWDPAASSLPRIQKTVGGGVSLPGVAAVAPAAYAPSAAGAASVHSASLAATAVAASTTRDLAATGHGRSFAFTREFGRGISGGKT